MSNESNNKRIAKNTLLLYFRMLLMMGISLYTSRVILGSLGVEDYGIYNVVGGVVAMFSILSGSLSAAISRFITFELGANNEERLKKVFSTSVNIQLILSCIIIVLMETIGVWFLNNKIVLSEERLTAANWVFQLSVVTFTIGLISVPYNAVIIAHEKMSAFAYISIFDACCKLFIAIIIAYNPFDRLVYYALLMFVVVTIDQLIYLSYCKKHFIEAHYHFFMDASLLKTMFGFAGWNFIGASSAILRDQGGNIIINLFFGPTVNAARGIAMQVNGAINGFVNNFMTALNPQITKNYANGNHEYMMMLIFQGARLSFFILYILSLPVIINAPYLLHLWLSVVPDHTINFVRLVLVFTMSESLATPLITAMLATGKIRNYQIVVGGLQIMNLPLSYICLQYGMPAESVLIVAIIISILCELSRLIMLKPLIGLSPMLFLKKVYLNVIFVAIIGGIVPFALSTMCRLNFISFLSNCLVCLISSVLIILYLGCSKNERLYLYNIIIARFRKLNGRNN